MSSALTLYPAIDLKDGACVRLVRGDMAQATVFSDDPAEQARAFESAGFAWLHVVDLNGAFAGRPVNADAVAAIVAATDLKVQLGGGIRDLATIEDWLGFRNPAPQHLTAIDGWPLVWIKLSPYP